MAHTVIWSEKAQQQINQIINYLYDNWSFEVAGKFTDQLVESSEQLALFPFSGKENEKLNALRELYVKPYHKLYYTVIDGRDEVYILNVIDTRQQ
ncbi:MAG: type II toxin-antitoxin system RelE/ParE family toxin [Rudanella sp.]|nr:type II toxin-antitoxin system RelE/ParE family toxin [Rudanella sp.]